MATDSAFAGQFNAAVFIDAIKNTMKMGIPQDPAERLVFHWRATPTITEPKSPGGGSPYSWDQDLGADPAEPTPGVAQRSLQVDYAIEPTKDQSINTMAGTFENPTAAVTLLDAEYELVKDADFCTIGTSIYRILYHAPTIGLFGVEVHTLMIQAQDEA